MSGRDFTIPSAGTFTFTPDLTTLFLRLPLDVLGNSAGNAKFRLTSADAPAYDKTLTREDDLVQGDAFAELLFAGVFAGGRFTLEVDPGDGRPKAVLFKDRTLDELTSGAAAPPVPGSSAAGGQAAKPAGSDLRAAREKEQYR